MFNLACLYLGATLTTIWGVAHLFPTRSVVRGFGDISADNKRIIAMEWIVEGVALIFIGLLTMTVAAIDPASRVSMAVFVLCALCLVALAVVSLFTGFRVKFVPFKLCPVIFTASAVLILMGALL